MILHDERVVKIQSRKIVYATATNPRDYSIQLLTWGVVPHAARQCPVIEENLAVDVGSVVSARFATLQYHALIEVYREEVKLIGNGQLMLS